MDDMAFQSYCVSCDKLCGSNSIYCSDKCKQADQVQALNIVNNIDNTQLVSPLLAPMGCEHDDVGDYTTSSNLNLQNDDVLKYGLSNLNDFRLDYINSKVSRSPNRQQMVPSTSHNYRKWLTAYK